MQSYTDIQSSQSLQSSLSLLLNNDKTALSCSSGTAFPTSNLQAGMLCYRTDQKKLYLLQDVTPTWKLLLDLNTSGNGAASEGIQSFLLRNSGGADEGGELVLQKPATGSTLSGNIAVDLYKDKLRIFDSGTSNGFYIDLKSGVASAGTEIWHDANDGSGSGLDADLLDGMQSGNADGNIPINNGTVNTNLNADMVDGKHVGNASGNVPVSNGVVNTGLNADMLDGFHATSFVRTIQGVAPDVSGNVVVDLASKVSKSGDTMTGNLTAPRFISNVAAGTAPLQVTSTTVVGNLNADLLDGYHASSFAAASHSHDYVPTDAGAGGIGAFALAKVVASYATPGGTISGAYINSAVYVGSGWVASGSQFGGTWRNLSNAAISANEVGLFQRIA